MERLTEKYTITATLTMIFPNGWSSVTTWSTWMKGECMRKCSIRTPVTWGLNGRPGAWYGWILEGAWLREVSAEQGTNNSAHCSQRERERERERERDREREYIPGTSGCAKLLLEVEATLFFAVWDLLFSKNNAVSWLGFCLLGNACQPDLFLRFLG